MRIEDIQQIKKYYYLWKENKDIKQVTLLSPAPEEKMLINDVFPDLWVNEITQEDWNLFNKPNQVHDLVIANNIFMYSTNPWLWFKNILNNCRYLFMQDLVRSRRTENQECANGPGGDEDYTRFCYPPEHLARIENAFNLQQLNDKLLHFVPYQTPGCPGYDALSFLAALRGELA